LGRFAFNPLPYRGVLRGAKPEHPESILERFDVLLNPELDHLRPVPNGAEVRVDSAHHLLAAVAELA
jgi:hypothetical protein